MSKKTAVLVGCGGMAGAWLNAVKSLDTLTIGGLVDLDIERCQKRKEDFELTDAIVGTDLDAVLKKCNADVLFDCTTPNAHAKMALTGIANGCHILCEKPIAASVSEAKETIAAAEKAGVVYAVIQNRRYLNSIVTFRNTVIDNEKLGNLTTLNCDFYLGPHFGGFREEMDHVLLLDMSIHTFDQARYMSGKDPVSVYCHEWNPSGSWFKHGASAIAIFEMTDGVVYTYRGSWCANGMGTPWQADWRAVCENGTLLYDGDNTFKGEYLPSDGESGFTPKMTELPVDQSIDLPAKGHEGVITEFLACIDSGQTPLTVASDNIKSLAMVDAAILSAKENRKVLISEVL